MKVERIIEDSWLRSESVLRLMKTLNEGAEGDKSLALFVGGCVRNACLGVGASDVDIATKLVPDEVVRRCTVAGLRVVPTGIDHGTVTVPIDGVGYEVTTLRRDVATDGRRATVSYSGSWAEDAERRDFTMNTLLCDSEGQVYDPLGCGLADLDARRVVFVGDPAERIAEDVLRILRFFRFHASYGAGDADDAALRACAEQAEKITDLSRERVTQEMKKILMAERAVNTLKLMFDYKVLLEFSDINLGVFERFCKLQAKTGHVALFSRLFFLKFANAFDDYFLFNKAIVKDIESLSQAIEGVDFGSDHAVKVMMYRFGREVATQAYLMMLAQNDSEVDEAVLDILNDWDIPVFPVKGKDLLARGLKQGPELGQVLKREEQDWVARGFQ